MYSSQVATWITPARFAPYLAEADGDPEAAVALYVWNARISAAAVASSPACRSVLASVVRQEEQPAVGLAPAQSVPGRHR
jgi:hypothetical protein